MKKDTILVLKDGIWHERAFGSRISLCGEIVDSDVSPGISQMVFERLSGTPGPRCYTCQIHPAATWPPHGQITRETELNHLVFPGGRLLAD